MDRKDILQEAQEILKGQNAIQGLAAMGDFIELFLKLKASVCARLMLTGMEKQQALTLAGEITYDFFANDTKRFAELGTQSK